MFKKVLALISVLAMTAELALADACQTRLMPAFTAAQAIALCTKLGGSASVSIIPQTDNAIDLGSTSKTFRTLYTGTSIIAKTSQILRVRQDAQRLFTWDASSDTAFTWKFGDAGTTAVQQLTVSASTADADDDSTLILAGGGAYAADGSRGASITLPGEEVSGGSDITYVAGAGDLHQWFTGSTQTMYVDTAGALVSLAGYTATTGNIVATAGDVILSTSGKSLKVLSGSSIDADLTTAVSAATSAAWIGTNVSGSNSNLVANIADTVPSSINGFKTRAAANSWDANTIVASGDSILNITGYGADGAAYQPAARISLQVNGTPGASDMPGSIVFQTTPDGSATLASVLTLSNAKVATFTGTVISSATADLGWSVQSAANQACNTTCTSACVVGQDSGATNIFVGCATATADVCLCAGAS